ncbi:hypothetical protein GCM10023185_42790 [Hymenobacter saemangeumensis]|uniref:Uncharacterized protein n=1 Tax=Hymenobacter saemangeumensis TaxID=1084522 RepID=A0ABP8IRS8_9BACT
MGAPGTATGASTGAGANPGAFIGLLTFTITLRGAGLPVDLACVVLAAAAGLAMARQATKNEKAKR